MESPEIAPGAEAAAPAAARPFLPVRPVVLAAALAAAIATAGIATIPFYTRGEPREGLVVQEMIRGNGWILPLRNATDIPRKPPFFHWLAAGTSMVLGHVDEVTMRLPSAAGSVFAIVLVFLWASAGGGATQGLLTAAVTATSFEWMRAATVARVDMVYASALLAAVYGLARLLRGETPRPGLHRALLYGGLTAATLTKGPVALVLVLLAIPLLAFSRGAPGVWRRLRAGRGLLVVLLIVTGWVALAARRHGDAFMEIVLRENIHHLVATDVGATGHAHSAVYLVAVTLLGLLPWTPLLPFAVVALRHRPRDDGTIVAAVWTALVIGLHLLASAKRAVYLLPAYPAIALLIMRGADVATGSPWASRFLPTAGRIYATGAAALALALAGLAFGVEVPVTIQHLLKPRDRVGLEAATVAATANAPLLLATAVGILAAVPFLLRAGRGLRWRELVAVVAIVSASATVIFNTAVHPIIAGGRSLKEFMSSVAAVVRPDQPLYFLGGVEPAAVFYADRNIAAVRRGDPLPSNAYVLLWERDWLALGAGLPRLPAPLKVSATKLPGRGHLLLIAAPAEAFWQREAPSSGAQPRVENAGREAEVRPNEPPELRSPEGH
jgi:4-amino-4-deoxy-L-arabinose transferase-like glycosyltransferase